MNHSTTQYEFYLKNLKSNSQSPKQILENSYSNRKNNNYNQIISYFDDSMETSNPNENPYNYYHNSKKNRIINIDKKHLTPLNIIKEVSIKGMKPGLKISNKFNFYINNTINKSMIKFSDISKPKFVSSNSFSNLQSERIKSLKNMKLSRSNFNDLSKIKKEEEDHNVMKMVNTITNRPKDISLIRESVENIKEQFPEIYVKMQYFINFEFDQSTESKQADSLLNYLNMLLYELDIYNSKNQDDLFFECKSNKLLNIIFKELLYHLSFYSKKQTEFLKLIWVRQQGYFQSQITNLDSKLKSFVLKVRKCEEDKHSIELISEDIQIVNRNLVNEIQELKNEKEKLLASISSKENFSNQLEKIIELKNENILTLNNQINILSKIGIRRKNKFNSTILNEKKKSEKTVTFEINDLIKSREKRIGVQRKIQNKEKPTKEKKTTEFQGRDSKQKLTRLNKICQTLIKDESLYESVKNKSSNYSPAKIDQVFGLYLNKGIEMDGKILLNKQVQTDVTSFHFELNDPNHYKNIIMEKKGIFGKTIKKISQTLQNFGQNFSNNENEKIKSEFSLDDPLLQSKGSDNLKVFDDSDDINLKKANTQLNFNQLSDDISNLLSDCNLILKDNDILREKFEKEKDSNENLKESYQEALKILANNIIDNNQDINNYLEKNHSIPKQLKETLVKVIERNFTLLEKEKNSLIEIVSNEIIESSIKRKNTNMMYLQNTVRKFVTEKTSVHKNSELILDFMQNHVGKIKNSMPIKKVIKIVKFLYDDLTSENKKISCLFQRVNICRESSLKKCLVEKIRLIEEKILRISEMDQSLLLLKTDQKAHLWTTIRMFDSLTLDVFYE